MPPFIIEMVGPAGVGKSTIAAELGRRLAHTHPVRFRTRVRTRYLIGLADIVTVLRAMAAVRAGLGRDAFFAFRSLYEMKRRIADVRAARGAVHLLDEGMFHRSRILCRYVENAAEYDGAIARLIRSSPPDLVVILDGHPAAIARRREQRDGGDVAGEQIARDLASNDRIRDIAEAVRRRCGVPEILRVDVDAIGTIEACAAHLESRIVPRLGALAG